MRMSRTTNSVMMNTPIAMAIQIACTRACAA